jgi:hypothetical protein
MAFPMAADAALAPASHVNDCFNATGAAVDYPQYPTGCQFFFYDGAGQPATFANHVYKDVVTPSHNETEVLIGHAHAAVPNGTGSIVTYNSANNPNTPGQAVLSFVPGKTTTNWTMTIQTDSEWNLTANFSK